MAFADRFVADAAIEPAGYRQITDLAAAVGVQIGDGRVATIQALNQNIRWLDDGQTPTASFGTRLAAGESIFYFGDLRAIRFIEETTGAEINLSAYK
jgi:hypothetical protein